MAETRLLVSGDPVSSVLDLSLLIGATGEFSALVGRSGVKYTGVEAAGLPFPMLPSIPGSDVFVRVLFGVSKVRSITVSVVSIFLPAMK